MYGKTLSDLGNILLPTRIYTLDLASICDSSLNQPLYDECKTVIFQLHHFLHVSQLAFCLKEKSSFSPFFVHIYLIISIYSWTPFFFSGLQLIAIHISFAAQIFPALASRSSFKLVLVSFWQVPIIFLWQLLYFLAEMFQVILYFHCFSPGIIHFSQKL